MKNEDRDPIIIWRILLLSVISCLAAFAYSATPIPADLVGIWATENSQFRGEALWKGHAIYLDADGSGAGVGGDGTDVLGVQFLVTSYDTKTNMLKVDLIDNEKITSSEIMIYDPAKKTLSFDPSLFSAKRPVQIFSRRANRISANMRKSLGFPIKSK
ncbi:hypothetical protein [Trinickia mobilis]|uniref:hypothetical protein n=1 Tax=Trinickia mobilis TaxID=2816356 RepID=UPI001A8C2743|nr:hypothetical protein [Trinickia mobilis]